MHRRRGSAYILVLGVAMIVAVIGLAAISARRIRTRSARLTGGSGRARMLAFSGAEHAIGRINADPDWRTTYNGATVQQDCGEGAFSWEVVDPADGDLTDDPAEAAEILATGVFGEVSHTLKLELAPVGGLIHAVLADGEIEVGKSKTVTISGAPLASNSKLTVGNKGTLNSDVLANEIKLLGQGTINGTVTTPLRWPAPMPSSDLFNTYKATATEIPQRASIEKTLLSPTDNPYGPTNPNGLYYINVGSSELIIRECRIYGTLLVEVTTGRVRIGDKVLMESFRSDYPTLIVTGNLDIEMESGVNVLNEADDAETNLNPPGSPFEGVSDSDTSDDYPNEIRGLVHTTREVTTLKNTSTIRGGLICEGQLMFGGDARVIFDTSLPDNPPMGYGGPGQVFPGRWGRKVD